MTKSLCGIRHSPFVLLTKPSDIRLLLLLWNAFTSHMLSTTDRSIQAWRSIFESGTPSQGVWGLKSPVGSRGKAPVGDLGALPQKLKHFCN